MLLLRRGGSSYLSTLSSSSSTQSIFSTYLILLSLLVISTLTSAQHTNATFNSTSLITIPNTNWDLNTTKEISFRTCSDSGNLISMNGSLTSPPFSTPSPSSNFQELAVLLDNSSVAFMWSIGGQQGAVYAGNNINNNMWYTVTLQYLLNSVRLNVTKGSVVVGSTMVSNRTYNPFLLNTSLSGSLKIGEGFFGCLYQGPGVNFTAPGYSAQNVLWDSCTLPSISGCTNIGQNNCYRIPCWNGATCVDDGGNNYTCHCPPNFNGTLCEHNLAEMYGCDIQPCINQGTCVPQQDPNVKFKCLCPNGFTGVFCDSAIDLCLTHPCVQGICKTLVNSYKCNCNGTGYNGDNCTNDIDECTNTTLCGGYTCSNRPGGFTCVCPQGYNGVSCLDVDECLSLPCQNGGTCNNLENAYSCNCAPGYTGLSCEDDINECYSNPCPSLPNTTCRNLINNYTCGCMDGFSGNPCVDINECSLSVCRNNASCNNTIGSYNCSCPPGFTDKNCSTVINACSSNPCGSNGNCSGTWNNYTSLSKNYTCSCQPGYSGINCEHDIDDCVNNTCLNYQVCHDGIGNYTCVCPMGTFCGTNIDDCESFPCQHNGTCTDGVNSYTCGCVNGTTGLNCEKDIDDCNPNPCLHGGGCTDHLNSFTCNCNDTGFNGTTCELNIDNCVGHQCENGGVCKDGVKSHTCDCFPAYTGSDCEIDIPDCRPNPCAYNSTCLENSNISLYDKGDERFVNFTYENAAGFVCVCVPGLEGPTCGNDTNECLSGPCQHNSSCNNIFKDGFNCSCSPGYEGHVCENEINECIKYSPCKNGGSCVDKLADYDCICPSPLASIKNYGGKNCTTYLQGCDSRRYCIDGKCIPKLVQDQHFFDCDCDPGYTGKVCSESTDMSFRGGQNNYIMSQMNTSEFNLSLRFQTTLSNVVLVMWKLPWDIYVSIELINGKVNMIFKVGSNRRSCMLDTLSTVNNSDYHQLDLAVSNNISLILPLDRCQNTNCSTQNCQMFMTFQGIQPPPMTELLIGSGTENRGDVATSPPSYVGCMEDVRINDHLYYPGKQIGQYFGVSPGCSRSVQCTKDSCSRQGFCDDLWDSYECKCYRPYYGVQCENEYQSATFGINQETVVARYRDLPGGNDDWVISFFITTKQSKGFIAYFGKEEYFTAKKESFVGLYIDNGQLLGDFYKCGYISHFNTSRQISDGKKHFVSVDIKATTFKVILGSDVAYQDFGVPASNQVCYQGYGFTAPLVIIGNGNIITSGRGKRDVRRSNLHETEFEAPFKFHQRLRRQAANNSLLIEYQHMPSLQGVIQDVEIATSPSSILKLGFNNDSNLTPADFSNATIGTFSTNESCLDSPCKNGGTCTNIYYNDYNCTCTPGFTGKSCNLDYCFYGTCPSESTCHNLQEGYECISTASFSTDNSIVTYNISGDLPEPVLTFDFRTRGLYGLIFLLRQGDYFFKVRVAYGRLEVNWKLSSNFSITAVTKQNKRVNNGIWYQGRFEIINGTYFKLQVMRDGVFLDDTDIVRFVVGNFSFEDMLRNGERILGSSGREKFSPSWEAGYNGCLREVRMGGELMPFFSDNVFKNNTARNRFIAQRVESIVNNCAGRNACDGHSCLNGGNCVDLWNDYKCDCPVGLGGALCQDNPDNCLSQPCLNGGVCVDGLGTFTCTCPRGFSGNLCQDPVDMCNSTNSALCENNSTCTNQGSDFMCTCTDPWYTGWYCNVSTNQSCSPGLCQNGGTCNITTIDVGTESNVSSFNCTCPPGYKGQVCEKIIDKCNVNGNMCANNGQCINVPENNTFTCKCNETLDYGGANCSERVDNCLANACSNQTCIDGIRSYTCWCNGGTTGPKCDSIVTDDKCQNKSLCQHGDCTDGFCNCTGSGYTRLGCEIDVDECSNSKPACLHNGNCTNTEGSFNCSCTLGYEGPRCEIPNCTGLCQYGGTCQNNATDWWCSCPNFVEGTQCELPGPCYFQPCNQSNMHSCSQSKQFSNYTCICDQGWSGANCTDDVDECKEKIDNCTNDSNCSNTNGSYICICQPGYTGRYCDADINECDSSPCQNGGICNNGHNNYTCNCTATGYEGTTCTKNVNECTFTPPICNRGICMDLPGNYSCNCTDKYVGNHCEADNPCYNNTVCQNGGKCQYNLTQTHCLCTAGFEGVSCEKPQSQTGKGPDLGVIIGPIVGGVVLIILIIVIIAFVMTARSKRATRGAYSPSQQETSGSRVEMGNVLKKPPEERLI